jgi:tetratricopeptide (TPR) repeat protein
MNAAVAATLFEEAQSLRRAGDARALVTGVRACSLFEKLAGGRSFDTVNARLLVAGILLDRGAVPRALTEAEVALDSLGRTGNVAGIRLRANALLLIAASHVALGRYREAIISATRALKIARSRLGRRDVVAALNGVGIPYRYLGRHAKAEASYREALSLARDTDARAALWHNLAGLAHERGRFDEAVACARRAVKLRNKVRGTVTVATAADVAELAAVLHAAGSAKEARPLYRWFNLGNLAALEQRAGRRKEARRLYTRSIRIEERAVGRAHPDVALLLCNLAKLALEETRYAEARRLFGRALPILRKHLGPKHANTLECARSLASLGGTPHVGPP